MEGGQPVDGGTEDFGGRRTGYEIVRCETDKNLHVIFCGYKAAIAHAARSSRQLLTGIAPRPARSISSVLAAADEVDGGSYPGSLGSPRSHRRRSPALPFFQIVRADGICCTR